MGESIIQPQQTANRVHEECKHTHTLLNQPILTHTHSQISHGDKSQVFNCMTFLPTVKHPAQLCPDPYPGLGDSVCVCVCVCVCACFYLCVYLWVWGREIACVYVCVLGCMCVGECMYMCVCVCEWVYIQMWACVRECMYMCVWESVLWGSTALYSWRWGREAAGIRWGITAGGKTERLLGYAGVMFNEKLVKNGTGRWLGC